MKDGFPKIMLDANFYDDQKLIALTHQAGEQWGYRYLKLIGLMRMTGNGKLDCTVPGFEAWLAHQLNVSVEHALSFIQNLCHPEDGKKHGFPAQYALLRFDGRHYYSERLCRDINHYERKTQAMSDGGRRGAAARWGESGSRAQATADIYLSLISLAARTKLDRASWNAALAQRPEGEREKLWQLCSEFGRDTIAKYLRLASNWLDQNEKPADELASTVETFILRDNNKGQPLTKRPAAERRPAPHPATNSKTESTGAIVAQLTQRAAR